MYDAKPLRWLGGGTLVSILAFPASRKTPPDQSFGENITQCLPGLPGSVVVVELEIQGLFQGWSSPILSS